MKTNYFNPEIGIFKNKDKARELFDSGIPVYRWFTFKPYKHINYFTTGFKLINFKSHV